eukprot:scaffold3228_cov384-Prasinococcus_capsulatus_cf.AAC.6
MKWHEGQLPACTDEYDDDARSPEHGARSRRTRSSVVALVGRSGVCTASLCGLAGKGAGGEDHHRRRRSRLLLRRRAAPTRRCRWGSLCGSLL